MEIDENSHFFKKSSKISKNPNILRYLEFGFRKPREASGECSAASKSRGAERVAFALLRSSCESYAGGCGARWSGKSSGKCAGWWVSFETVILKYKVTTFPPLFCL